MLIIREEQRQALRAAMREPFIDRVMESVGETMPQLEPAIGTAELRRRVADAVARALGHGFETNAQVTTFVGCALALGDGFEESPNYPWAAEILADRQLAPDRKLILLLQRVRGELLDEAER